ncbi:hypothetical protein ZTR_10685 [Talaromyces verruculosus]|nr:hypothetical protein ZTR_10685 [Talaromyces verruculosus]
MRPVTMSLSPELMWHIIKPFAEELASSEVHGASIVTCKRDIAVNFFRRLYHSSFPNPTPLLSGDMISDYIRAMSQSLECRGNLPPPADDWDFGRAFNGPHVSRLRAGSSHDDRAGTPPTLDTNTSHRSDEDAESSPHSPDHGGESDQDPFLILPTDVDFEMSGRRSVEWATFPTPTAAVGDSVKWASFPPVTAAPWTTLESGAGNDFEKELREYGHFASGQVDYSIASPSSMASLGDSHRDDMAMTTPDAELGGDPKPLYTPPALDARRSEHDLPARFSEGFFQMTGLGATGEHRIHDVELAGEEDTGGDLVISDQEAQAGLAGGERFPVTVVDPRVLVDNGGGDDERLFFSDTVLSQSVLSDADSPADSVSTDLAAREVVVMDHHGGDVAALHAMFKHKFPPSTEFHAYGTTWTRDMVLQLLTDLESGQMVTQLTMNYMVRRLRRRHHDGHLYFGDSHFGDLCDGRSDPLEELPLRLLVPVRDAAGRWSLVEASPPQRQICHYVVGNAPNAGCPPCHGIQEVLDRPSLVAKHRSRPDGAPWQHHSISVGASDDSGFVVIWLLHVREYCGPVDGSPPAEMRFLLAQELVEEMSRSAFLQDDISSPLRHTPPVHHYWVELERRGYPGLNEERLALMKRWGFTEADRLYQLAFNIASPLVFVDLQKQLARCRGRQRDDHRWGGVSKVRLYHVLKQLETNDQYTQTRLRLGYWQIGHLFQRKKEVGHPNPLQGLVEEFRKELNPTQDSDDLAAHIQSWYRSSWPWMCLAHAGGGPLLLCLLPCGVNHIPGCDRIFPTSYRKLKKEHMVELERILKRFRPHLLSHLDPCLVDIFLYSSIPPCEYELESWDADRILGEPLDSENLQKAMRPPVS